MATNDILHRHTSGNPLGQGHTRLTAEADAAVILSWLGSSILVAHFLTFPRTSWYKS